jgi:shikimate kinase
MQKSLLIPTLPETLRTDIENKTPDPAVPTSILAKTKVVNLPSKIFLTGFMGSGKTHWGRIWASESKLPFFDLDTKIEKAFKMNITEIFEKKGEVKFRELERYHLRKFENRKSYIMACGGGTPCFSDNLDWMKAQGQVIYLKATPEHILKYVMDETEKRPVIKDVNPSELLFFIQKKLAEREPVYSQADHILDAETLDKNSLSLLLHKTAY